MSGAVPQFIRMRSIGEPPNCGVQRTTVEPQNLSNVGPHTVLQPRHWSCVAFQLFNGFEDRAFRAVLSLDQVTYPIWSLSLGKPNSALGYLEAKIEHISDMRISAFVLHHFTSPHFSVA